MFPWLAAPLPWCSAGPSESSGALGRGTFPCRPVCGRWVEWTVLAMETETGNVKSFFNHYCYYYHIVVVAYIIITVSFPFSHFFSFHIYFSHSLQLFFFLHSLNFPGGSSPGVWQHLCVQTLTIHPSHCGHLGGGADKCWRA